MSSKKRTTWYHNKPTSIASAVCIADSLKMRVLRSMDEARPFVNTQFKDFLECDTGSGNLYAEVSPIMVQLLEAEVTLEKAIDEYVEALRSVRDLLGDEAEDDGEAT